MKKQMTPEREEGGRERRVMSAQENATFERLGWELRRVFAVAIWAGEMSFARMRAPAERSWWVVRPGPQPSSRIEGGCWCICAGDSGGDDPGDNDDDFEV